MGHVFVRWKDCHHRILVLLVYALLAVCVVHTVLTFISLVVYTWYRYGKVDVEMVEEFRVYGVNYHTIVIQLAIDSAALLLCRVLDYLIIESVFTRVEGGKKEDDDVQDEVCV
jgi:hypothetical protein